MASWLESVPTSSESPSDPFPRDNILADFKSAEDRAKELSLNLLLLNYTMIMQFHLIFGRYVWFSATHGILVGSQHCNLML
jgi:hypothetical protein